MMLQLKIAIFTLSMALGLIHLASAENLRVDPIATNRNDYTGSLGCMFTSTSATTVINSLGFVDAGSDGLNTTHLVSLYQLNNELTYDLVTSVTVDSGTTGFLDGGYRWASISPVTLSNTALNAYIVIAQVVNGDGDNWGDTAGFNSSIGTIGLYSLVSPTSLGNPHIFTGQINNAPAANYNSGNISTLIVPGTNSLTLLDSNFNFDTNQLSLTWKSSDTKIYRITSSTDLLDWNNVLADNIPGQAAQTSTTYTGSFTQGTKIFFRVEEK
jgi:hypothetical protein